MTRRASALGLLAALLLAGLPSPVPGAAAAPAASPLKFGMDVASVADQTNAGVAPDYGSFWVGVWNEKSGWGWVDTNLDRLRAAGVTPMVQFYYWGDDISSSCVENGCWSSLHGAQKTRAGWDKLADGFTARLTARMNGAPVVIILESEFNKGTAQGYEPMDGYLAAMAERLRAGYPQATVVLGFGNWNYPGWAMWDRAAAASDAIGVQGMRGSTRDSLSAYLALSDALVAGAQAAQRTFGKPVFIDDVALSSYPEPTWADHQATAMSEIAGRIPDLAAAGVFGMVYRSFRDSPNMDPANYYG
ncbi:MAG: hypothetical protein ACT4PT_09135, partial [Methanobacteriota archaeon]